MRIKLLLLIVFVSGFSCLNAQEAKSDPQNVANLMELVIPAGQEVNKEDFLGIWQLCEMKQEADGYHLRMIPMLKVFLSDDSFMNLLAANNRLVVMAQGSYEKKSETLYEENIKNSLYINIAAEIKNQITYEFLHDDLLKISFPLNMGTDQKGVEYWHRVSFQSSREMNMDLLVK